MSRFYLGLDCSTQSMSAVLIDADSDRVVYEQLLNFSTDLKGYGVTDGFLPGGEAVHTAHKNYERNSVSIQQI